MIKPHGADTLKPLFVYDTERHHALMHEAETLPSVVISSAAAGNAVMMGGGYFTPLTGFMNVADAMGCAENMRTTGGLFFPVPVVNLLEDADAIRGAKRIALRDPNMEGNPILAIQEVEAIEEFTPEQMEIMTQKVYGTTDPEHPGVAAFNSVGHICVSGPIEVLHFSYFQDDFPDTFRTAVEIRNEITERGWKNVVAFQTRNPMHRAHEELCRMAMDQLETDGVVVHMLLGKLKAGDIPAPVRDAAIRKMAELYFPPNTVMITGYGFDMLYAGPREAVLHALFRQNMGTTHFIIGRDHAGVGGAIDLLGHELHLFGCELLDRLDVLNGEDRVALHVGVTQGDSLGSPDGVGILQQVDDRDREEETDGGPHVFGAAHGVGDIHEAGERSEVATPHHHGVTGGS